MCYEVDQMSPLILEINMRTFYFHVKYVHTLQLQVHAAKVLEQTLKIINMNDATCTAKFHILLVTFAASQTLIIQWQVKKMKGPSL